MANYSFTAGSVSGFSCYGVSDFKAYYKLITGSTASDSTVVNLDTVKTTHCAASTSITNTINKQMNTKFIDGSSNTFNQFLASGYNPSGAGTVKLPYYDNGTQVEIVLPGTVPQFNKRVCYASTSSAITITIKRTSSTLTVTNNGTTTTYYPSDFDGVIPLRLNGVFVGGGGGGSSSHDTQGGGGGGGGATQGFILDLATVPTFTIKIYANGGGAGGSGSWGGTEAQHSGKDGASVLIFNGSTQYALISGAPGHDTGETMSSTATEIWNNFQANGKCLNQNIGWPLKFRKGSSDISSWDCAILGTKPSEPGNSGSGVSSTYYAHAGSYGNTTYFSGNPSNIYMSIGNKSGGSVGSGDTGDNRGGGGGASTLGNGGGGGYSKVSGAAAGSAGSTGGGGGGGGFYFGTWKSGGKGGAPCVSIWY